MGRPPSQRAAWLVGAAVFAFRMLGLFMVAAVLATLWWFAARRPRFTDRCGKSGAYFGLTPGLSADFLWHVV